MSCWASRTEIGPRAYLLAGGATLASTALGLLLSPWARLEDLAMLHVLGIVVVSTQCSMPLSLAAATLIGLCFAFVCAPPTVAFTESKLTHASTVAAMLLVAGLVSVLSRRLSRQLRAAASHAERSAETERTRSSLLSAASHDLKTPLASILAAGTTLLERRAELSEQAVGELLSAVVEETERLSRLVNDLLSITRLESDAIVLAKSAESIEEIASVAQQRLRTQGVLAAIESNFDKELPLVWVDPSLIEQVLINLMTNAVRYAGGASPIELDATVRGEHLVVRVADRGPGVPSAERTRVFDKFYRSPSGAAATGGVGLGLAICRAIVTAHGGAIAMKEREGGGASVEFTLPVLAGASQLDQGGSAS